MNPTIPELWKEEVRKALTIPAWLEPYLPHYTKAEMKLWRRARYWRDRWRRRKFRRWGELGL